MSEAESVARDALRLLFEQQPDSDDTLFELLCRLHRHDAPGVRSMVRDFFEAAKRYAELRADWALGDAELRKALDANRSRAHDAFIASCNAVGRYLAKEGYEVAWRRTLGDHERPDNRRRIGDFACAVEFVRALSGR